MRICQKSSGDIRKMPHQNHVTKHQNAIAKKKKNAKCPMEGTFQVNDVI